MTGAQRPETTTPGRRSTTDPDGSGPIRTDPHDPELFGSTPEQHRTAPGEGFPTTGTLPEAMADMPVFVAMFRDR